MSDVADIKRGPGALPRRLPILSVLAPAQKGPQAPPSLTDRLELIRTGLLQLDEDAALRHFALGRHDRLLKSTISLCPECLKHVPALVYTLSGRVLCRKLCEVHGASDAVLENDERYYGLSAQDRWGRRYAEDRVVPDEGPAGACCGPEGCCTGGGETTDQMSNKTCTILVEVVNACNLACPVCYSDAKGDRKMPLGVFQDYIRRLIEKKGGLDSVQLTGGEALLHPEFWQMVAFLHAEPRVKKIYLPTNGLLLSREEIAERLVPFRDKLMVLLQFDGRTRGANQALRAADPDRQRRRALEHLARRDIPMQLTMTITAGVNDGEVGAVVDLGWRYPNIKVIALQPSTYSGRYQLEADPLHRATLSDLVKAVGRQARLGTPERDFIPVPCSHPNCGWITVYARRFGLAVNLVRRVDIKAALDVVANKAMLSTTELRQALSRSVRGRFSGVLSALGRRLVRSTDVFTIAIKPFMDRFSYDQDRISLCCHHMTDTRGNPVSFCEYNALVRPGDPWDAFPPLAAAG